MFYLSHCVFCGCFKYSSNSLCSFCLSQFKNKERLDVFQSVPFLVTSLYKTQFLCKKDLDLILEDKWFIDELAKKFFLLRMNHIKKLDSVKFVYSSKKCLRLKRSLEKIFSFPSRKNRNVIYVNVNYNQKDSVKIYRYYRKKYHFEIFTLF